MRKEQELSHLEKAITIAVTDHRGQRDKAGRPYILHPLRLMQECSTEAEMIVAVLHDVIEDTDVTTDHLEREGFDTEVIQALRCLTKTKGEHYPDFIERVSKNQLARRVKILDLTDNLDASRLTSFTDADGTRLKRYIDALTYLRSET